ncbi:cytochrome P450 [Chiua virens]|nr:cytochrome P450 [Chiua virens]
MLRFSAAVIMSIVYDYEVAHDHDHLVELFERGNELALADLTPERAAIVDAFPFRSLPGWLPGASISRNAAISKYCAMQMVEEPFKHARKREAMARDPTSTTSVALDLLKSIDENDPSQLQSLKDMCTSAFQGGSETEVQARAQAEIDTVVGANQLPHFDDRPNLPYIEATLIEILRLYPVAPLGVAHASTVDDIYEGKFIPKGIALVPNIWAMNYNEEVYPEPKKFKPERFLVDGQLVNDRSIDSVSFGFGRRVCPGRSIADSTVWIAMVSILYAFKIKKPVDEHGKELDFDPSFSHGITTAPLPFPCSLVPRFSPAGLEKLVAVDAW